MDLLRLPVFPELMITVITVTVITVDYGDRPVFVRTRPPPARLYDFRQRSNRATRWLWPRRGVGPAEDAVGRVRTEDVRAGRHYPR